MMKPVYQGEKPVTMRCGYDVCTFSCSSSNHVLIPGAPKMVTCITRYGDDGLPVSTEWLGNESPKYNGEILCVEKSSLDDEFSDCGRFTLFKDDEGVKKDCSVKQCTFSCEQEMQRPYPS